MVNNLTKFLSTKRQSFSNIHTLLEPCFYEPAPKQRTYMKPPAPGQLTPKRLERVLHPCWVVEDAGDFIVYIYKENENDTLHYLEVFGLDDLPVEHPSSENWDSIKHCGWSSKLPQARTQPIFTLEEIQSILTELYQASGSSWVTCQVY